MNSPSPSRKPAPLRFTPSVVVSSTARVTVFLLVILLTLCSTNPVTLSAQDERPKNVVLIMADDSAADNYGCYGSKFFSTPRLDELAREGARFTQCYSAPVCTASRVKIMTGRDNIRNYVAFGTLDRDETTFADVLKGAGYATGIAGKWQLHGGPRGSLAPDCGFDTFCLWNYPGSNKSRFWNPSIIRDGTPLKTTENDYGPDIFTKFIIEFLEKHRDQPFFAYYPMVLVHAPYVKTPDSAPLQQQEDGEKRNLRYYQDMTAYADKCVGKIVDTLDRLGLRENTVIIYTTDNGTGRSLTYPYRGEQRKGEKAYATDGGTHAPLIVNCPGTVPAETVCDDLVDFSDMLPTLAEIGGAELPPVPIDGRSFWQQCQGKPGNPREWIYQYYFPKFTEAAKQHGQGIRKNEIIWAQNHDYKLYRDGSLYATSDRYETTLISPSQQNQNQNQARLDLTEAIQSMPDEAAKLSVRK